MSQPSIAERVFHALVRAFPAEFRGDYGDQMTDDFRDQYREAASRGRRVARWRLWTRTTADILNRAPREHLDILRRDAAYALRQLRRRPLISAGAIATFGVGLGVNTAVFGLASTILWRSLPLPASERLVAIHEISADPANTGTSVSATNFADWQMRTRTLASLALVGWDSQTLLDAGDPEVLTGARVSRGFFRVVPIQPYRGRLFTDADYALLTATAAGSVHYGPTKEPDVAIISHELWRQRFGGRDDVIGRKVRFGKTSVEIVGVLPPGFVFPGSEKATYWQPMAPDGTAARRGARYLDAFGRLAPAVTLSQAQAEFDTLSIDLAARYPRANRDFRARLVSLHEEVARPARGYVWLLLGAAGTVLLIACASIGNLLLAQISGRRLEFATRSALGASRGHLVRQMLTESLLIAVIGGVVALLLARWAMPVLTTLVPQDIPRLREIRIDGMVIAFTAAASIVVGLICGVLASFTAASAAGRIRHGMGADANCAARRFRLGLTVVQIALALALAIGTGLLTRTLRAVAALDLGFVPTNVLSVGLNPQSDFYRDAAYKTRFDSELEARVRALPGVVAAGIGSRPLGGASLGTMVTIDGSTTGPVNASLDAVGPGYLEALGARLFAGRFISAADTADGPRVAVVNRAAGQAWWPAADPLGRIVIRDQQRVQVVGVIEDVRRAALEAAPSPTIYLSAAQTRNVWVNNLLVRTAGDARSILPALRDLVHSMDREQPLARVMTLEESLTEATAPRRNLLWLVGFFSAMALLLAVIGIYGVVSENVAQRVPEIGVRMALGADAANVVALMARQGLWLILAGTSIGMAIAVAFNRAMTAFVFGVATTDAVTYAFACLCTAAVTITACLLPAVRAARIDAVTALRQE